MDWKPLFTEHIRLVCEATEDALKRAAEAGQEFAGIVMHAGTAHIFHADDQHVPFRSVFHLRRFTPQEGPDHLLLFRPGQTPKLIRVIPRDFWYEPPADVNHPFPEVLEVSEVATAKEAIEAIGQVPDHAYIGNDPKVAEALGIAADAVEPFALMAPLDWHRAYKTPYEVECVKVASEIAARGHAAVRAGMAAGKTEREMHADYLAACGILENDTPYGNIIGWDEHGAILHYQSKVDDPPALGMTLLVDAGAPFLGYASDVTRTYAHQDAHPAFKQALDGMDRLELDLLESIKPGDGFIDLHRAAHRGVGQILGDIGVLKCGVDEALEKKLTLAFFPHGLGHHLGLQVHDVGGRQAQPDGTEAPPPDDFPALRTTRQIEAGQLLTVEPGLYFIPMLLEPVREGEHQDLVNWALVDALTPLGGIRVEDDVLVTATGNENLTRHLVPGHND